MKFSELREEFEGYESMCQEAKRLRMPAPRFQNETRQRVNLSDHAHSILLHDMDAFHYRLKIAPGSGKVGTEIINHIFRVFREDANASIYHSCKKQREVLEDTLKDLDEDTRIRVISPLIKKHRETLRTEVEKNLAEKGESHLVRIDKDNLFFLGSSNHSGWKEGNTVYNDKIGSYIKAVIEEYSQKPYLEREAIFCKADMETIQEAIREKRMIQITTRNRNLQYVKPYMIQSDHERLYHYLSGYFFRHTDGSWNPGSIRLSSITECTILSHSGALSPEQADNLKAAIQKKGIQFLSNTPGSEKPQKIVVRFTEAGKRMYHQMLHLRPMYDGTPKGLVYEFITTQRQAENYFFKFGHNVKILVPEELADKFSRRYESAAKQYRKDP